MSRRQSPTVNSGSMADIAFLLLIFFLLTTTISAEQGIERQLPSDCLPGAPCSTFKTENNIARITVNSKNEILFENNVIEIDELQEHLIAFIDNNKNGDCDYCNGDRSKFNSDHPKKAFIALEVHPSTSYDFYIDIQDEISKAYLQLRKRYAVNQLNVTSGTMSHTQIKQAKNAYPFNLLELK